MKRRRSLSVIHRYLALAFFLYAAAFAFADTYNEVAGSGIHINSVPGGAKVFLDGVERGTTPYSTSSIRGGEYSVRVEKEGYVERRFHVVIRRDSRVEISVDLQAAKGQIILKVSPSPGSADDEVTSAEDEVTAPAAEAGAFPFNPRISIDGERAAAPELAADNVYRQRYSLPVGWRTVIAEAFGWERKSARVYVDEGGAQEVELFVEPAAFALSELSLQKKRFNPRNAGALGGAEINFRVNAPGGGVLEVRDSQRTLVYSRALGPFTDWQQQALWDGRNSRGEIVPDGTYTLRISAWRNGETRKHNEESSVEVDTSITMRPLSVASSVSGLLFAPTPETLPAFSYQIEGSLIAGKPLLRKAWESFPFAIGLRVSFLDKLELAAAFNAAPGFSDNSEWGAGGSVKWAFLRPNAAVIQPDSQNTSSGFIDALGVAAELSYGWATAGPYTAFGMGTGLGLRVPLMYRILEGESANSSRPYSFDVLLSPLVLWAGEEGYPESGVPRIGAEGGAIFSYGMITTGISVRWDYDPDSGTSGPIVSALEFKLLPSSFSISVSGGFWRDPAGNNTGAFFGAGMGIMY